MNCIDEEEDDTYTSTVGTTDDQFSSVQSPPDCISTSIYSSKQSSKKNARSKNQTINRPSSLPPARHSSSLNQNIGKEVKQRRRYASDSNTNTKKTTPTLLVTSFLQYLRNELRVTTSDKKNDYQRHIREKSSSTPPPTTTCRTIIMNSQITNEKLLEINDDNEILALVDLLVLRVECLANENKPNKKKKTKDKYPTVAEVDQNLIEYLYYLFTKFVTDDSDSSNIDKKSFLTVCQTLVRNGCFDMPSPDPDQSISDSTTSSSDQTITPETFLHEYNPDSDKIGTDEPETWLIVDLEPAESEKPIQTPETICIIPNSTSDEQLLLSANDNDKSYESESSPSIYLSPNTSLIDLQAIVQEFDEINNPSITDHGSTLNVTIEPKTRTISNDDNQSLSITSNNICTRLTNDDSSIENTEQIDKMLRREKKMQERWSLSTKNDNNEQSSAKPLIGIEFPQISVLRRKFSSSSSSVTPNKNETNAKEKIDSNPSTTIDSNPSTTNEEINTSPMISIVDNTNPDQINESPLKDVLLINNDVGKDNDDGQLRETVLDEEITMKKKQDLLLPSQECQTETITNHNNELVDSQQCSNENSSIIITNPLDSSLLLSSFSSPSSPPLISISTSSLTLTTNENNTIEPLLKEKSEEEEEQRCNDDYNLDEEKKDNSSFVCDYHAPGIILINDEPTQTALLQQEKKEKKGEEEKREQPSSPLLTLEQFNQQRTEDESPPQTLSNELSQMAMTNIDENEERYKKVEIEEIPDDEEAVITQNIDSIEPTDYIHTDDEPKKKSTPSNSSTINDGSIKFDNVFSSYEKVLSKVGDPSYEELFQPSNPLAKESSSTTQQIGEDPIALRALQRFQERMNAAAAAKTSKEEINTLSTRGKSSWSGSLSTPRKSIENLFKTTEQQLHSTPVVIDNESKPITSSIQSDSHIQRRKTFDENTLNYGLTSSTIDKNNNNDDHIQDEQQQQPSAILENDDKRVVDNKSMTIVDSNDQQKEEKQQIVNNVTMINENLTSIDNSQPLSTEQSGITSYRFQLEGRRRLNTLERMRENRQSRESLTTPDEKQLQLKNDYTLKPEETQDPIIRRALERFDEKSRTLTQTKSMNYDEIQDPITRRALMRLESNLKKTIPPIPNNNSNENWYTENYTLGSLQPTNDRVSRYTESSLSNTKPKYISIHQHYCTPSSNEVSDVSTANEQDISVMRVSAQPIYVTSNNPPLNVRQRSRSEDMLTSKDLTIGQTTNLDDVDTTPSSQLQRNQSSNEIALNEPDHLLPNTLIKALEPNFVRTTESSVSYATPTQTYSAYSCEYTRPRRNPLVTTSSETPIAYKQESNQLPPPTYSQQQQNEIQRPTPYRPTQTSSAFAPVESSTSTTTSNYYGQQPLPTSSYDSMYTSNNLTQPAYSEDPIIRRALDRFNSQMQNSLLSTSQYQPPNNYLSRQGTFQDSWMNNNNNSTLMSRSTSSTSSGGYQSIIGRRRNVTRQDDSNNYFVDNPSVGDGYSSSMFYNSQNSYPITNHYMNISDEPPTIPPRFRRDIYRNEDINDQYRRHSTDEYLSENLNNNNNNSHTLPREAFIHHAYPATITNATGFRPINLNYNQLPSEQDDLCDRAQSTSSTNSSDSLKQQRSNNIRTKMNNQQRLPPPPTSINEQIVSNNSPSDQPTSNNGNISGDSVFHRLAYTGTKASLSKSNSNSCSNLLNKNSSQLPSNQLKSCEIDFDDSLNSTIIDHTTEQQISTSNKYQRSKSVDTRARLKFAHSRSNDNEDNNDEQQKTILSSKFTPVNTRQPPRVPLTPTSTHRTTLPKRPLNGNRNQGSNGSFYDTDNQQQDIENEENISFNDDNYQPKLLDNRMRTSIPVHRYIVNNNNNIQTSTSTSSVSSNISRTKPPISLDRRDSNTSITDSNRISRRPDDNRLVSPIGQRRNVPVSVFAPAKLDNKRPAPAPPTYNYESQQQTSYLSRLSTSEHEMNNKKSAGNFSNEYSVPTDKQDNGKKMNVFERLFRGNKKKN